jgi:hypothetical protein
LGVRVSDLEQWPAREIEEWIAYYKIEPFGETRDDMRIGFATMNLLSPHFKKGHKAKLKDYMLDFEPKQQMSNEQIKNVLMRISNGG